MRILIRTSRWAIWARRLGSFALPLAVIPVVLHRQQVVTTEAFNTMELVAFIVAALALLASLVALVRLWISGDRGWDRAFGGLALALLCLAPFIYGLQLASHYPRVSDVATENGASLSFVNPLPAQTIAASRDQVESAFPNAHARSYELDLDRLYKLVRKQVADWDWTVLSENQPGAAGSSAGINAIAPTWLGWRDEVAIRLSATAGGADIEMRSASLAPSLTDLGANGRRIEDFLLAIDNAVTIEMRDNVLETPITDDNMPPSNGLSEDSDVVIPAERPPDLRPPPPDPYDTEAPPPD